jgi:hypothetical protein
MPSFVRAIPTRCVGDDGSSYGYVFSVGRGYCSHGPVGRSGYAPQTEMRPGCVPWIFVWTMARIGHRPQARYVFSANGAFSLAAWGNPERFRG